MSEQKKTMSKWGRNVVNFENRSPVFKAELLNAAKAFHRFYKEEFGIDLFVSYGVLLGFTRGNDFIGHDDDFDFAYISSQPSRADVLRESARIIERLIDKGLQVVENSFGHYKVWVRDADRVFKFEIFVGWQEANAAYLYFGIDKGVPAGAFLPLQEHDFHGVPLPIPNQPEVICEALYGSNWRTPDPGFRYHLTPAQWAQFSFLFTSANKHHWNSYYQTRSTNQPWSILPSQFAAFIANEVDPGRLLEVGCGNGRDSLFFASVGFDVTAADYSSAALELCSSRAQQSGHQCKTVELNVYDLSQIARFTKEAGPVFDVVYARFFIHAISEIGERNFWRLCSGILKAGGKCCVEFRTNKDKRAEAGAKISDTERSDGHYRRFISIDEVRQRAEHTGLSASFIAAGTGMAAFRGEDPHVGRLVVEKTQVGPAA